MIRTVKGVEGLRALVGNELGVSTWQLLTQQQIDRFAELTGDRQWIHTDPQRAKNSRFGATVAHGYYTLSLAPMLCRQIVQVEGFAFGVNYGLNRVRFPAPLPVGSRFRLRATLLLVEEFPAAVQVKLHLTFERDDLQKPVCVAESLLRFSRTEIPD